MYRKILMLGFGLAMSASFAGAQMVSNGGKAGSADTSTLGQASEFSNVTTTFDGVEIQVRRLLGDPKDKSKLRFVAQLLNSNPESRWILMGFPFPRLVDDLGNEYGIMTYAGIDACRFGDKDRFAWRKDVADCSPLVDNYYSGVSTLLGSNVPVTFSIVFAPLDKDGVFDADMAKLSTSVTASISFLVANKDFDSMGREDLRANTVGYKVVIPQIPLPAQ